MTDKPTDEFPERPMLTLPEIESIERLTSPNNLSITVGVATLRELCATARIAHAREHTPAEAALRKIVDAVWNEEHGLYSWKIDAPMDADMIASEISRVIRARAEYSNVLAGLLNGPTGARKRAEDAEGAARAAWRDRIALEHDIALLLRLVEDMQASDAHGQWSLRNTTTSQFCYYRAALAHRYAALKGTDGKWMDGRGDYESSRTEMSDQLDAAKAAKESP